MKTLNKQNKDYILKLVEQKEINSILSFCDGLGIDTTKYSSSVHYFNGKLTIRYRTENTYYYL